MDVLDSRHSDGRQWRKTPWWLATTSPVVAVMLTVVWAGLFLFTALSRSDWDAWRIVQVSIFGVLTVFYAIAAGYLARRG